jgi:uncharacterized membrane protein YhaH (DUF805 family)
MKTYSILGVFYSLDIFVPGLAETVRRIHHPVVFNPRYLEMILLIFLLQDSQYGEN